ncbi:MFS transporter [Streptomyces chryseus]|uniref:MFS transporter n=1 Tax=Streptomyces chryseus TaxID=68186 RepID=UPI00110F6C1D|nr:MFS transporter [Streptomyces chryseus]
MTTTAVPKFRRQLILSVLMVCSLLIWLDNTVLSTTPETLADPARRLNAVPSEPQWATGPYTPAFATLMFAAGALGDRFGHRAVLVSGLVVFAGASVWAAYAGDAGQLIAARAAMGVGSALIMPANPAIVVGLVLLAVFVLVELLIAIGAVAGAPVGARLVQRWSPALVTVPALTVAALTTGAYGLFGLQTPLLWIELLLLAQGLTIGMVIGPVTAALVSTLPLERAGAGSAVTNTVRQTGTVIGIAVGGTIMSIVHRRAIEPSLDGVPGAVQVQARISAEQARHIAEATDRPALGRAGDDVGGH